MAVAAVMLLTTVAAGARPATVPDRLLLVTLDTTRGDVLGCAGGPAATPVLDSLADRGTRWARALAPAPLTLPSHATLLTGLDPPGHGLRVNGRRALGSRTSTLASELRGNGFATAAVVASRVLDRRFGLARGFDSYDDAILAERIGEYGYPERDAVAVTGRALAWLGGLPEERSAFLWVHYYDPHAPYEPLQMSPAAPAAARYEAEVEKVDRELGRLLAALPGGAAEWLVAVVGDHGEALGEHGEETHGIFLYEEAVHVPLIVAGAGVPAGRVVDPPVGLRQLPATLLTLLGLAPAEEMAPPLQGLPGVSGAPAPVYGESRMPAETYGWAPLRSLVEGRWRYIDAPRPELYDLRADPDESRNLVADEPALAVRLAAGLDRMVSRDAADAPSARVDGDLRAALETLGYVSGAQGADLGDGIDPKDGIGLLAEFRRAGGLIVRGDVDEAVRALRDLTAANPSNVPFRSRLGAALLAVGDPEGAVVAYQRAVEAVPDSELLRLRLAEALLAAGQLDDARAAIAETLDLDPRLADAWLLLARMASLGGDEAAARDVLANALDAGVVSVRVHFALAASADTPGEAATHAAAAVELAPGSAPAWRAWGVAAARSGLVDVAVDRLQQAVELDPADPESALELGRLLQRHGDVAAARGHLLRAKVLGRGTAVAEEAGALLEELGAGDPGR